MMMVQLDEDQSTGGKRPTGETATVVGILLGETVPDRAARMAERYRPCPYCASFTSAGGTIVGLFAIPPGHRWWLEEIEKRPQETLGLDRAEVFFAQRVEAASSWSRGEVQPVGELSPCGSDCSRCPAYRERCPGCPSTRLYLTSYGSIE